MVSSISSSSGSSQLQQLMAEMQKRMKSADTDGTKGLSKDEISSVSSKDDTGGTNFLNSLTENFSKIDTDSDGQLSEKEIAAYRPEKQQQMGPPPGMFLQQIRSNDTDGSTGLSKDELSSIETGEDEGKSNFIKKLTENFDKIDANGDGQITSDEVERGKPQGPPSGPPPSQASTDSSGSDTSSTSSSSATSLLELFTKQCLSSYKNNSTDWESTLNLAG